MLTLVAYNQRPAQALDYILIRALGQTHESRLTVAEVCQGHILVVWFYLLCGE